MELFDKMAIWRRRSGLASVVAMLCAVVSTSLWPRHTTAADPGAPPVVETRVQDLQEERNLVTLPAGAALGVRVGDPFWIVPGSGEPVVGEIILVLPDLSSGRLEQRPKQVNSAPVVIVPGEAMPVLARRLPARATLRGNVERTAPGRETAWISLGRSSGLAERDGILVRRSGISIARGRVMQLGDRASLIRLQPVVGNAITEAGDSVELWPEPADARMGRLRSTILATQPSDEGTLITFAGTAADGLHEDRLLDIYRDGAFVGVASVVDTFNPISRARMMASATSQPVEVGDQAWARSPAGPPARPLTAPVFKVEGEQDYCLIAAGEVDGITSGEKLLVRRPDPASGHELEDIAELTVDKVNVDYSGAYSRPLNTEGLRVRPWDFAERKTPPLPRYHPIGVVSRVLSSRTLMADVDLGATLPPGTLLRLASGDARGYWAGIVLRKAGDHAFIYVPPGWGEPDTLAHAGVEMSDEGPDTLSPIQPSVTTVPALPLE